MRRSAVLNELAARICAVQRDHALRVAIDGIDAAGKTTLADELAPLIREGGRPVIRASVDGFHNPQAIRYARGPLSPEGYFLDSFNLALVIESILAPLGPDGDGRYRSAAFDYRVDTSLDVTWQHSEPGSVLLFDGIFLNRPELAAYWDYFVFAQIGFDTCLARAWDRNDDPDLTQEALRSRYQARYLPAQQHYLASHRPMDRAEVILVNDDLDNPRLTIN